MSAVTSTLTEYRFQLRINRFGLWLFFISEAFLFGGLLVARFYLWGNTRPDLDQSLGLVITSILLLSSFFMNRAEIAAGVGDNKNFLRNTLITIVLGVFFLVGVVFVEWPDAAKHISVNEGVAGSVFFTMTGFHAFHVLTGIIFLLIVWNNGRKG